MKKKLISMSIIFLIITLIISITIVKHEPILTTFHYGIVEKIEECFETSGLEYCKYKTDTGENFIVSLSTIPEKKINIGDDIYTEIRDNGITQDYYSCKNNSCIETSTCYWLIPCF